MKYLRTMAAVILAVAILATGGATANAATRGGGYGIDIVPAVRIMPLGDSITVGQNPVALDGGYRSRLTPMVRVPFVYVGSQVDAYGHHEGHSGWTSADIRANITPWTTAARPTHVLFMIGTNDVFHRRASDQMITDLVFTLDAIHAAAPSAIVVVAQIPYATGWDAAQRSIADNFNAGVPIVVDTSGRAAWARYVDMRAVHLSTDGIHPDAQGYQWMATKWLPFLPVNGLRPAGRVGVARA